MPKRSSINRPRDPNQLAKLIADIATGEISDAHPDEGKNPAAVALGRLGGQKVENHAHAVALHFMFYNFGRIHKSLRITPAMAAGVSDHVWTLEEIVDLAR